MKVRAKPTAGEEDKALLWQWTWSGEELLALLDLLCDCLFGPILEVLQYQANPVRTGASPIISD
jgi:hypothetical protein